MPHAQQPELLSPVPTPTSPATPTVSSAEHESLRAAYARVCEQLDAARAAASDAHTKLAQVEERLALAEQAPPVPVEAHAHCHARIAELAGELGRQLMRAMEYAPSWSPPTAEQAARAPWWLVSRRSGLGERELHLLHGDHRQRFIEEYGTNDVMWWPLWSTGRPVPRSWWWDGGAEEGRV